MTLSDRVRGWLLAVWAVAVVVVLALNVLRPLPGMEDGWPWAAGLMAFPVAAALVLARRPGNVIGRVLGMVAMAAGAIFTLTWYAVTYPASPMSRPAEGLSLVAVIAQFAGLLFLLHLFPTGRPFSRTHARLLAVMGWWFVALAALGLVQPGPLGMTGRPNPFGVGAEWTRVVFQTGGVSLPIFTLVGIWVLVARRRRAGTVERAQLQWFITGAGAMLLATAVIAFVPELADRRLENAIGVPILIAFWSLPAAVVVAITRYRLYEIDRIVSRTATYSVVAGALGLVYAGSVVGLQAILPEGASDLAIAASTLAAAGLFSPLRRWVQESLNRRFNRSRYEADLVARQFTARLRQEVDLDAIDADLSDVVTRTLQPVSVHLWLQQAVTRR